MADAGELEGLDKVIAWVKNIYIFGLFEGETGEEAPWYLKPVSLIFIVVQVGTLVLILVVLCGWWTWILLLVMVVLVMVVSVLCC